MKIDRLIGILSILLQQEKVTAPFLAAKFEVSRRTINRDIEDICKAGIPLVTTQGQNGGISIMEGYTFDRTVLTSSEMNAILTGLRSLDSVSGTNKYQQLMDKLSVSHSSVLTSNNHILIDLSSRYKSSLAPKIEQIQNAIDRYELICFQYHSPNGNGERRIEPYLLVFQWSSWYVWGYCLNRSDYRLFKLNRMIDLENVREEFTPRDLPPYEITSGKIFPHQIDVVAVFKPQMKWRVIEEFGMESFTEQTDGQLLFEYGFTDKENLFSWLLSFGNQVELLEPKELRAELSELTKEMYRKYVE
ncbi:helix-turn-helix transcriptional regulator [Bacillus sp. CGMCC 1.16607]|uniref:helix-turn-helix transcriptional regulator n=1 Tax=Bacillus sp. CGMCC 1.16607 TaxID=3351842 RepID=UPI00363DCF72